jgi:hypothetical protein
MGLQQQNSTRNAHKRHSFERSEIQYSGRKDMEQEFEPMHEFSTHSQDMGHSRMPRNESGFGGRSRRQRSSMSCQDYGSGNFGMHDYKNMKAY